jgi:hypothetical protein
MIKHSYPVPGEKQNPLFQQYYLQGRIHARDYAFYMRKLSFMQQQKPADKKEEDRNNNNG